MPLSSEEFEQRHADRERLYAIRECYELLRRARNCATAAAAPRTADRIRLAITSCGGAIRHAEGRVSR